MKTRIALPILTLACLLVLQSVAAAGELAGPRYVHPHRHVTFGGKGFRPHSWISVEIQPSYARGNNLVQSRPTWRAWRADGQGKVEITLRFPSHYFVCKSRHGVAQHCKRHRWQPGMQADVDAYAKHRTARQVVRVIHRR